MSWTEAKQRRYGRIYGRGYSAAKRKYAIAKNAEHTRPWIGIALIALLVFVFGVIIGRSVSSRPALESPELDDTMPIDGSEPQAIWLPETEGGGRVLWRLD